MADAPTELAPALAALGLAPRRLLKDDSVSEVWELEGAAGPALLKRARKGRLLFGLPPRWLTAREVAILEVLADVPGIPRVIARLDGRTFAREFAAGRELGEVDEVPPDYFVELIGMLAAVHTAGVACVDLSKRDNILIDDAGHPVLMDFQAGWYLRPGSFAARALGPLLRLLQRGDVYHVYKHHRKRFPDAPIPPAPPYALERPLAVRLHAWLLRKPYLAVKRRLVGRS